MKNKQLFLALLFAGNAIFLFGQDDPPVVINAEVPFCQNIVVNIDTIICEGSHFMGLTQPGIYYDTFQIANNCDSITVTTIDVVGPIIIQIDTVICEGESFLGFSTSGLFTYDSINPETECTEVVILDLVIIPFGTGPCLTGIEDMDDTTMSVYPNPAHSQIYIETSLPIEAMRLLSSNGSVISINDFTSQGTRVSLQLQDGVVDGFYILVVKMDGKEYFEKLVVNK